MGEMTREQAARVLERLNYMQCTGDPTIDEQKTAVNAAIACLRSPGASPDVDGKAGGWLDTAIDKPTDPHETVIVQDANGNVYTAPGWIVRDFPGTHPRWMKLPKKEADNG